VLKDGSFIEPMKKTEGIAITRWPLMLPDGEAMGVRRPESKGVAARGGFLPENGKLAKKAQPHRAGSLRARAHQPHLACIAHKFLGNL
jgi:hypothetical protein